MRYYNLFEGGRALRIAVGITALIILLFIGSAGAVTLTVNASGGAMYTKIQDAINYSNNGDMIIVFSGIYYENVNVNKEVVLRGVDDGSGLPVKVIAGGDSENAIILSAGNSMLEGFTAYGVGYGTGIIVRSDNNIIRNNTATNYYQDLRV
jgi:pectin methylesterase-like acyl-CoA thioesterase